MSFIYKITNTLNNKVYIGLTTRTVESRWKEHCRHSSQMIDREIQEYGVQNFTVETIEECSEDILDARETYWIDYYDSFNNGYNNTLGGRDNNYIMTDKTDLVLQLWEQGLTINRIVEKTHLNVETVRSYLNKNNITHEMIRQRANRTIGLSKSRPVIEFSLQGEYIKQWNSAVEASEAYNIQSKYITATCRGQQKTYNNRRWKYADDTNDLSSINNNCVAVSQYTLDKNLITNFTSIAEASKITGIDRASISKACAGKLKTAGKYIWRYTNEGIY